MTSRRVRLSIEPLEDRTTPATVTDLFNYAYQTNSNAWLLNQLNHDPWRLANPAIRPMVQSFFTTIYQQATTTTQLLNQFPGALPPGVANMVAYEAAWEAASAKWVGYVLGFSVVPAPAPITPPVTGPASPATSSVSINPPSVAVNGTVAVLLTARNAAGTQLTTGGATVTFGLGNGTAQGTFTAVTDNHDGTYSATFTATVAGTNTITATIGGQAVTSTAPTLTVTAAAATADPAQSTVSIAPPSVQTGGTATVTLTARDVNGVQLPTGGATVVFNLGNGTAQGTFSPVTDHGNGTYTATFTAGTTTGTNTITATINSVALTSTAPSITVTAGPGPVDLAQSTVAVAPGSVAINGTATVTLTAKDASGTQLTTGGLTVAFGVGAGTGQGNFTNLTDNGDGTYTATFTGTVAGDNTITATIGGQPVTSTAPSITVTAGPGPVDLAQSTVAVAPGSVAINGTATVTLTAKDANGTQLTTGGLTVAFGLGNGAGQGTFTNLVDHGDGTYTATFTGNVAGNNTITATIGGQPVTSTAPSITVTAGPGPVDLAQSTVAVAPGSVAINGTATVTLTAKDASGTQLTTGGLTVAFGLGAGAGQGTFTNLVDHGDGTYTATFTGTVAGDNTITATIGGQPVTSTAPSITVTAGPGPIDPAQSTVSISPASVGITGTATVTLTAKDASGTPLTTGGATVAFGLGNGAGQGTFTNVVDHGDGTYTATFTGTTAGPNTITATINSQPVTTQAPTVTVIGPADPAQSTVTINPSSIATNGTATVTLTAKDANGVQLTTGGATVVFDVGAGVGQGTFTNLTDHGDGTYTATFTGTVAGDNTIVATLNTQPVTSSPTFTVT